MTIIKKVAKNSTTLIIGDILDTICNFAISISLARYFGQSGFGKLAFLATFFFFLGSVDNQWIRPILVREISKAPDNSGSIVGNGIIIKTCISIIAIILFWITIWFIGASKDIIILAFFTSLGLLTSSLISSYVIVLQVHLRMLYFVGYNFLSKIFTLLIIYGIVFFKGNLLHFYLLSLIPGIILLLGVKHCSERMIKPVFKINFKLWHKIFKESWPLGLTALFIFVYHRLDHILLFYLKGADEVGLYSAAVKLTEGFNIIPVALMTSALPLMSRYYEVSKNNFDRIYQISFKYLLIFIIPVAFVMTIFSGRIVSFFYGKSFLLSAPALQFLIWADIFIFLGVVNNAILISSGKQKIDPIFTGTSAIVNIVLNLILIPKYGFCGAALVSLITYSIGPIMGYFIPLTHVYSHSMLYYSLRPFMASMIMAAFIYYSRFPFIISLIYAPLIYLLVMYIIKGLGQDDFRIIKSIFLN